MTTKGFRVKLPTGKTVSYETTLFLKDLYGDLVEMHTGTYDRNNTPIYEGDFVRSMSCAEPFEVKDVVSFLMMCGEYKAKNGVDIFDSLEVCGSNLIKLRD